MAPGCLRTSTDTRRGAQTGRRSPARWRA
jgi:hypothetical protein